MLEKNDVRTEVGMLGLALPLSLFLTGLPDRKRCVGSSIETGAPIVSSKGVTRYVKSIAQIDDAAGGVVGWVYLARGAKDDAIYVQVRKPLDDSHLIKAGLHWLPENTISSVAPLGATWPWSDLTARKCSATT